MNSLKHVYYRNKRHILFALITVVSLALPWITIGGKHFF
jgi:hypothetical protein